MTTEDKAPLTIRLGPAKAKLLRVARDADVSVSLVVRLAVDFYLESLSKGEEMKITIPVSAKTRRSLSEDATDASASTFVR